MPPPIIVSALPSSSPSCHLSSSSTFSPSLSTHLLHFLYNFLIIHLPSHFLSSSTVFLLSTSFYSYLSSHFIIFLRFLLFFFISSFLLYFLRLPILLYVHFLIISLQSSFSFCSSCVFLSISFRS